MNWQPFPATQPALGERVLVFCPESVRRQYIARLEVKRERGAVITKWWCDDGSVLSLIVTHWQPLLEEPR